MSSSISRPYPEYSFMIQRALSQGDPNNDHCHSPVACHFKTVPRDINMIFPVSPQCHLQFQDCLPTITLPACKSSVSWETSPMDYAVFSPIITTEWSAILRLSPKHNHNSSNSVFYHLSLIVVRLVLLNSPLLNCLHCSFY